MSQLLLQQYVWSQLEHSPYICHIRRIILILIRHSLYSFCLCTVRLMTYHMQTRSGHWWRTSGTWGWLNCAAVLTCLWKVTRLMPWWDIDPKMPKAVQPFCIWFRFCFFNPQVLCQKWVKLKYDWYLCISMHPELQTSQSIQEISVKWNREDQELCSEWYFRTWVQLFRSIIPAEPSDADGAEHRQAIPDQRLGPHADVTDKHNT